MTHSAEKYEELRQSFLQAAADCDGLEFYLGIAPTENDEKELVATGQFDIPCHTRWPYEPWWECGVLAPCAGKAAAPYARLKDLAANCWLRLGHDLVEAIGDRENGARILAADWNNGAPETIAIWAPLEKSTQQHHYQGWLRLLWTDFWEDATVHIYNARKQSEKLCSVLPISGGSTIIQIEPFSVSAAVIDVWGLNRDSPTPPDWVAQYLSTCPVLPPPANNPVPAPVTVGTGMASTTHSPAAQGEGLAKDLPLGDRPQNALTVLLEEKAFDSDHRIRTQEIAKAAAGSAGDPNQFKEVIATLKRMGYVDTKEGRGGGCWLTASGRVRAEKL